MRGSITSQSSMGQNPEAEIVKQAQEVEETTCVEVIRANNLVPIQPAGARKVVSR
jgi:hypothetical protein